MWLFRKTQPIDTVQDSVKKDKANTEESKNENNPISAFECLKEKVENVKIIHEKLEIKKSLNNNTTNTLQENKHQCESTNEKETGDVTNCKIEYVLRIIPALEKNLLTLGEKVSYLSGFLDVKHVNNKIITDQDNIANKNSDSKGVMNKTKQKSEDTTIVSKQSKKTTKNKKTPLKKKKKSNQTVQLETNSTKIIAKSDQTENDIVMTEENEPTCSVTPVEEFTSLLDGRLESLFTKILESVNSALIQFKIDQENEKLEIMDNLSKLENKMNINENHIDKLMCNVKELSKQKDPAENVNMKNQPNIEIISKQDLQKMIEDVNMKCKNYTKESNTVHLQQTQQSINAHNPITDTNINSTCNSNRCVCKLIDNTNTSSTKVIKSHEDNNKIIKHSDINLCQFLKSNVASEKSKQCEHQQLVQVNQCSNQNDDDKKISNLSTCPKKSNHSINNCIKNLIEEKNSSYQSLNSEQSKLLKKNCVKNQNEEKKICSVSLCPKQSILSLCPKQSVHTIKFGVENVSKSCQTSKTSKTSVCGKTQICDFLLSQPIPEWIRRNENLIASDNPCKEAAKSAPSNCSLYVSKFYNIERKVKDSSHKNDIFYEITKKPDVPEENVNVCLSADTSKRQNLVPHNSFNNKP